jgi:hypothetical protein
MARLIAFGGIAVGAGAGTDVSTTGVGCGGSVPPPVFLGPQPVRATTKTKKNKTTMFAGFLICYLLINILLP